MFCETLKLVVIVFKVVSSTEKGIPSGNLKTETQHFSDNYSHTYFVKAKLTEAKNKFVWILQIQIKGKIH